MKIIDIITSRLQLIFPEISGKFTTLVAGNWWVAVDAPELTTQQAGALDTHARPSRRVMSPASPESNDDHLQLLPQYLFIVLVSVIIVVSLVFVAYFVFVRSRQLAHRHGKRLSYRCSQDFVWGALSSPKKLTTLFYFLVVVLKTHANST